MKIKKYSLGQLQTNCYFIIDEENNCLIIDPADEANFLLEEIQINRLKVLAILATHGHFDHLLAIGEIQKSINIPLYISKKDFFLIDRLKERAAYFLGYQPNIIQPITVNYLTDKKFIISNFKLQILKTPGHTPGSVCFYLKKEKILFSGDTLLRNAVGRYDFSYSSKNDLIKSLKKIISLPEEVVVYPGHGEKTTIKLAKNYLYQSGFF